MKPFIWLGLVVVGGGLITGCTSSVNSVERADPEHPRMMVSDKRIIADAALNRHVRIVGVSPAYNEHMSVSVELQNTTRSMHTFSYLFEWFDENGILISSPTATYVQRQIEGKESIFINAVAPTPKAKDFRLKLIDVVR
ncbi:MAG: YcfL family protein [Verrucomicrobiota bacterium]